MRARSPTATLPGVDEARWRRTLASLTLRRSRRPQRARRRPGDGRPSTSAPIRRLPTTRSASPARPSPPVSRRRAPRPRTSPTAWTSRSRSCPPSSIAWPRCRPVRSGCSMNWPDNAYITSDHHRGRLRARRRTLPFKISGASAPIGRPPSPLEGRGVVAALGPSSRGARRPPVHAGRARDAHRARPTRWGCPSTRSASSRPTSAAASAARTA